MASAVTSLRSTYPWPIDTLGWCPSASPASPTAATNRAPVPKSSTRNRACSPWASLRQSVSLASAISSPFSMSMLCEPICGSAAVLVLIASPAMPGSASGDMQSIRRGPASSTTRPRTDGFGCRTACCQARPGPSHRLADVLREEVDRPRPRLRRALRVVRSDEVLVVEERVTGRVQVQLRRRRPRSLVQGREHRADTLHRDAAVLEAEVALHRGPDPGDGRLVARQAVERHRGTDQVGPSRGEGEDETTAHAEPDRADRRARHSGQAHEVVHRSSEVLHGPLHRQALEERGRLGGVVGRSATVEVRGAGAAPGLGQSLDDAHHVGRQAPPLLDHHDTGPRARLGHPEVTEGLAVTTGEPHVLPSCLVTHGCLLAPASDAGDRALPTWRNVRPATRGGSLRCATRAAAVRSAVRTVWSGVTTAR